MTNANTTLRGTRRVATFSALAAGLLAGLCGAAWAGSPAAASVKVAYGDLDVATEQGSSALYARIVSAARQVCGGRQLDIRDLNAVALEQACERQAVANAVQDVHSQKLAAVYSAHLHGG